jgi:hypothetical protein
MRQRGVLVAIVFWPLVANAQATPPASGAEPAAPQATPPAPGAEPAPPATSPKRSESTREILADLEARHEDLAKLLDTANYGPAFASGAQAEFVSPTVGTTALLIGYDAVFMEVDADVGMGFGGDPLANTDASNSYTFGLRVWVPVHRGVRADYSIGVGAGASVVDPPQGSTFTIWNTLAGGRIRCFLGPNVALLGALGAAVLFHGEHSQFLVGARPMGGAGFVYYFR